MIVRPSVLAQIILLAAWLGAALVVSGVVAPAAFDVLPTRALAGAVVGRVLPVLFYSGMALGVAIVVLEGVWGRGWIAPPAIAGMLTFIACAIAQFVIGARIDRVRTSIPGALEALAPDDPRRVAFGRLHAFSVAWLGLAILAALVALVLAARVASRRS